MAIRKTVIKRYESQAWVDNYPVTAWAYIENIPSTFPPSAHTHNYAGSSSAGGDANNAVKLNGQVASYYLNYNNFTNTPTIPTKASWNYDDRYVRYDTASQGLNATQKSNARTNIGAGTSNFSGSYNDLTNKPTIPTKVSQLTNDSGYLTSSTLTGDVVIDALGYTPGTYSKPSGGIPASDLAQTYYLASNPNGYTSNIGTVTTVKLGSTSYSPSSGVISLPAYPTTLPASDVYAWAKAATKPSYTLDEVSDGSTRKLANYLPLSGGTLTGLLYINRDNYSTKPSLLINKSGTIFGIGAYTGGNNIRYGAVANNDWTTAENFNHYFDGTIYENGTSLANKYQAKGNYAAADHTHSQYYLATNPNGYTSNTGTVTSIAVKMNGSVKGTITTSGTIDLGTVITSHQDISGKADKASMSAGWYRRVYVNTQGIVTEGDQGDTDTNTWRKVQLNGVDKLGNATSTNPLNIKNGSGITITESSGAFTFALNLTGDLVADALGYTPGTSNFSGSYNDLTNKPTIPTKVSQLSNDSGYITGITSSMVTTALGFTPLSTTGTAADSSKLNGQAASYYLNYNNLSNKPTIYTDCVRYVSQSLTDAQKSQARTNIGAGTSNFTGYTSSNKLSTSYISGLATVATSGSYNDLSNKPTIPNVPSWALQSTKPSYDASEITCDDFGDNLDGVLSTFSTAIDGKAASNHTHDTRYVRFDTASQGLNSTQKSNARTNIGAGTGNGTVTSVSVKINGTVKGTVTTSGTIDLGTIGGGGVEIEFVGYLYFNDDRGTPVWFEISAAGWGFSEGLYIIVPEDSYPGFKTDNARYWQGAISRLSSTEGSFKIWKTRGDSCGYVQFTYSSPTSVTITSSDCAADYGKFIIYKVMNVSEP